MGILIIFHCLVLMKNYDEAREWKENISQLGFLYIRINNWTVNYLLFWSN
jgi:hypothetical protein